MPVYFNGKPEYVGQVINTYTHYWLDGMLEEFAVVWDVENHKKVAIQFGYYGIDGTNLAGGTAKIDISREVARDMIRTYKADFIAKYTNLVYGNKRAVKVGRKAEVIRGRKVKIGTILDVFWVGERETYLSRQYSWMNEKVKIAGCYDENGNKVWIMFDYLKNVTPVKSPTAKERKEMLKRFISTTIDRNVLLAAMN